MNIIQFWFDKITYYASNTSIYGFSNFSTQIIFALCPAFLGKLDRKGWLLLLILLGLSIVHYRFLHIFFVLVLIRIKIPDISDKKFYRELVLYSAVLCMWAYFGFITAQNWIDEVRP